MPIECYREILSQADEEEVREGKAWYDKAHAQAQAMAQETGKSVEVAAGVIAVLSPQVEWNLNLRVAKDALKYKGKAKRVPGYRRNWDKARAVMKGKFECSRGPKVRAFYETILNPAHEEPVLDFHMIAAWWMGRIDKKDIKTVSDSKKRTEPMRRAIKEIAREEGLWAGQVQAIIWLTFKRMQGRYCEQLKLWG